MRFGDRLLLRREGKRSLSTLYTEIADPQTPVHTIGKYVEKNKEGKGDTDKTITKPSSQRPLFPLLFLSTNTDTHRRGTNQC